MKDKDIIIIQKIVKYMKDVESFIKDMSFEQFKDDRKTMSASAFAIGQIGELVQELDGEVLTDNPNIPWKDIRGMRNRIVHDYENVDLTVLWQTLRNDIPKLLIQLNNISD